MDVIDEYQALLVATANEYAARDATALEIIERGSPTSRVPDLVRLRTGLIAESDRKRAAGFLPLGCFTALNGDERVAAFIVCFELDEEISRIGLSKRFAKYDATQPLFRRFPALFTSVRDDELVPDIGVRHDGRSGLVQLEGGWGRLEPLLPPELLMWARRAFPGAPLFVRLDPEFASLVQPERPLREAAVRPARSDWWRTLALRPNQRDGGHYVLQPVQPSAETMDEYWEYFIRGIRSLEVHAKREPEGRLSMMIEELAVERTAEKRLIGRCIHFDTYAPPGEDAGVAPLNHLDLAINAYFGSAATCRESMRLSDGMVHDASVRTHLLRIENIPFSASAEFARQFFHSRTLLVEWMRDQFGGSASGAEEHE